MFVKESSSLPEGYMSFHCVDTNFDRLPIGQGLVSCIYDDTEDKLHILEDNEVVGFFYSSFKFTAGMAEAVGDDRFAIMISPNGEFANDRQPVRIRFYVDKCALLAMFDAEYVPKLISALQRVPIPPSFDIPHAIAADTGDAEEASDGRLYPYQRHNAAWLCETDSVLLRNEGRIDYTTGVSSSFAVGGDMRIYFTEDGRILPPERFETSSMSIRGLTLADPLGMGKTASTLAGLKMVFRRQGGKTLLVVPAKVHKQWIDELRIAGLKAINLVCKRGFAKRAPGFEGDLYITTLHFLANKIHAESDAFFQVAWERVVIDEAHELSGPKLTKAFRKWQHGFEKIRSRVYWLISATPYAYRMNGAQRMLGWMSDDGCAQQLTPEVVESYISRFVRRTSEADISKWVQIPPLTRYDVLISMTATERSLYDAERNSSTENLIRICSHPRCNSFYERIFKSHEVVPLDVLALKAAKYIQTHLPRLRQRIANLESLSEAIGGLAAEDPKEDRAATLQLHEDSVMELREELRQCAFRSESLVKLSKQISEERCCICFEEFTDFAVPKCSHPLCKLCCGRLLNMHQPKCPMCRQPLAGIQYATVENKPADPALARRNLLGSKTAYLIDLLNQILVDDQSRVIVFSRWDKMLRNVEASIANHKYVKLAGNVHHMGASLRRFRLSPDIRIALLSADVCASGLNLTEADHVIILDVFSADQNAAEAIESQAIGRAYRLGQTKSVKVYRLIMEDTIEQQLAGDLYGTPP